MPVLERGKPGDVLVLDLMPRRAQPRDGSVQVAGVPEDYGVQDQAEGCELLVLSELAQPTAGRGYAQVESLKVIV